LSLPPTHRQARWAIAVGVCQVAALALIAPFAKTQLAEINVFIPAVEGVIFVTDLITSVLLFSQFAVYRLRALLVLACGYLFSALIIIPHALTFPGAFSPTGLLGAGLQTTASLYWFWHLLFPMALLGYGLMRDEKSDPGPAEPSLLAVIVGSVALVLTLACGLTLLATAGNNYLPVLFADRVDFTPAARAAGASTMLLSASAVAVLWLRRRSLLDQWLMIVALAAILEMALGAIFVSGRFSLGFYAGRLFSLLTSTIVLVVLLAETTRLYATVARSQEGKIRRLVDANIIGIFMWDFDGRILEANEAFLRIVGYEHEDLVAGRIRWTDLTPPEWRERDSRLIQEHKATGILQPFEKEYFRKDGSRVPVLIGVATFEEGGNQGVAFVLDLTERKRAEEALRDSERKLRQFIESVPAHFWSASPDGKATHVNQRLLDYFGIRLEDQKASGLEDQRPSDWKAVLHPDDVAETERALNHAFRTGESFQRVHRLRRADGEYRWHRARAEPLRDHSGNIIQWYGFSIDIDEGKKAEDQLRRNEAYLAEAQRISHTGSWALSPLMKTILYWSDESYRIWGVDPAQGLPYRASVIQRIHPDDRDRVLDEAEGALRQKRDYTTEFRVLLPDGTVKYLEAISHHVFSEEGGLIELVGTNVDVTERRRAEEALRRDEAWLAQAQRLSHTGNWVYDATMMRYLYWSEESYRIWGFDPLKGLPGREDMWQRIHPDDREGVWGQVQEALREKRDFFAKFRLLLPDGTVKYLEGNTHHEFSPLGALVETVSTHVDVTGRKRAEQALRESEAKFRAAIDGIAGLVAIMAPSGELEAVNGPIIEYFGRTVEELKNWGTSDAVHPEDLPRVLESYKTSLATGTPFHQELRLRRFDGEYRWFENRGAPIRDESGCVTRWYCLLVDIEDRTRALERLQQLQSDFAHMNRVNMMGELAASLSHEITQPIASARNNARAAQNFLHRQTPDLREVEEALGCVVADADRAGNIVDRIRDHIKKAPPRKALCDPNAAINEVVVLARSAIVQNGVSVRSRLAEGLSPIHGDRVQLQQVVLNLILNAVEAMGSSKAGARELLISTEQDHNCILVAVCDSGPGIDPAHFERVFDAFYTTKPRGVGMGLSICRSIINAHGGRLWAEANEPRGTVFQFTLPSAENNS
jgi:PAS domain S-box-containing protein